MKQGKHRIAFFGTPEFAIPTLDILLRNEYDICCVVTAPDKPAGRKRKPRPSAIKQFAGRKGLRVLQPANLKDMDFLTELRRCKPDLSVVVAFRILPESVWGMPAYGTINLHASLLPQYRGAAPINHAIINGEKESGVTSFFLDRDVDTGNIIAQKGIAISEEDNAGTLHDKLMVTGAGLVLQTVKDIFANNVSPTEQKSLLPDSVPLKKAPKIDKSFCRINWDGQAHDIYNFIRGLAPHPSAWTILLSDKGGQIPVKINRASMETTPHKLDPGAITADRDIMKIACRDGFLHILEIQQAGRKMMPAPEFCRGSRMNGLWRAL